MYSLYKGDCIDIMRSKINAKSIDLILTDLPYGQTHNKWDHQIPLDMFYGSNSSESRKIPPQLSFLPAACSPRTLCRATGECGDIISYIRKDSRLVF